MGVELDLGRMIHLGDKSNKTLHSRHISRRMNI